MSLDFHGDFKRGIVDPIMKNCHGIGQPKTMTDIERFLWLAQHPVEAAGISNQFSDQTLLEQHWNDTPEQRLEHFRKVIDYTIKFA